MASAADVRELVLKFNAQTELARREIRELASGLDRDTDRMERDLESLDKKTDKVGAAFGRMKGVVLGSLAALAVGGVAAGRGLLEFADDLQTAADRAGVGVERYQTLTRALRVLEVDAETVEKMFMKLQATMGDVQNGAGGSAVEALDRLGIKARILSGEIDTTDEMLDALAAASTNAGTQAQFAAEMADIFGARMSGKLVPALADGGTQLRQFEDDARNAGIITEEMAGELADANEKIDAFSERVKYAGAIALAGLIDWLDRAGTAWRNLGDAASNSLADVQDAIGGGGAGDITRYGMDHVRRQAAGVQARQYEFTARVSDFIGQRGFGTHLRGLRDQAREDFATNFGQEQAEDSFDIAGAARGVASSFRRAPRRRIPEDETGNRGGTRGTRGGSGGGLVRPVSGAVISGYGADRSGVPLNGRLVAGRRHEGVDLAGQIGDPVVAPFAGTATRRNSPGGLGQNVVITDGQGRRAVLAHLSGFEIPNGARVDAGQLVGRVGDSGNARGGTPHLHYQLQVGGRNVDPMRHTGSSGGANSAQRLADEAARAAQRLAETQTRNAIAMERELEQAGDRLLSARRSTATTAAQRARFELEQIAADREQADADARRDYEERAAEDPTNRGRYVLQLALLGMANKEVADTEAAAITRGELRRIEQERVQLRSAELDDEQALLQLQGSLATSTDERARIGHRLLDIALEQERVQLQAMAADTEASEASREIARRRLAMLDQTGALRREGVDRQNEGPAKRWMRELQTELGNVDEALEGMAVDAMRQLGDEAAAAVVEVLGLKGALGGLAERLVGMAFDQAFLVVLEAIFGGNKEDKMMKAAGALAASAIPLHSAAAALAAAAAALAAAGAGSAAGGGGDAASGLINAGLSLFGGKREHGGPVSAGRAYIVGEKRPELFVPSQSGFIVPRVPNIDMAGGRGGTVVQQTNVFSGNMMTQDFWDQQQVGLRQAAQAGGAIGVGKVRQISARRIPSY